MLKNNKLKIFNDPIYGFITIPNVLIFDLIQHKYFQRLRRITQMGMSYLVYPGAHHTRFHHALGCMHLMQKAVQVLRFKQVKISQEEETALYIAILLHDIGHGPFSHALEHSLIDQLSHEQISLVFMEKLNKEFDGKLSLAIKIFEGKYDRKFMCELISSQIDIDRADYLKRDSFYTGVSEGNVNSERLITMFNVIDDQLVIEEKGIYSIEKFLVSRSFMYWQVYLHKTGLVAEQLLLKVLLRAKALISKDIQIDASKTLLFFLKNEIDLYNFKDFEIEMYSELDDYDVIYALKNWQNHSDFVLSNLSKMIVNRNLLKIKFYEKPSLNQLEKHKQKLKSKYKLSESELNYFVFDGKVTHQAYQEDNHIQILQKNGKLKSLSKISDKINLKVLEKPVTKFFLCYPKNII